MFETDSGVTSGPESQQDVGWSLIASKKYELDLVIKEDSKLDDDVFKSTRRVNDATKEFELEEVLENEDELVELIQKETGLELVIANENELGEMKSNDCGAKKSELNEVEQDVLESSNMDTANNDTSKDRVFLRNTLLERKPLENANTVIIVSGSVDIKASILRWLYVRMVKKWHQRFDRINAHMNETVKSEVQTFGRGNPMMLKNFY